jgi:hypothetical protein
VVADCAIAHAMRDHTHPATFNGTVERFLRTPFVKRDRIGDAVKSLEQVRSLAGAPGR